MLQKIVNFLSDAKLELKRVSWPSRQDTVRYTIFIIVFSLVVAVFLGGLDLLFTFLLREFIL